MPTQQDMYHYSCIYTHIHPIYTVLPGTRLWTSPSRVAYAAWMCVHALAKRPWSKCTCATSMSKHASAPQHVSGVRG